MTSPFAQAVELLADRVDPKIEMSIDTEQEIIWRQTISEGLAAGAMTPEVVEAYAGILLRTEGGIPIRPAPHHKLWLQLLCDDRIPNLLILAPPEAAKTTWVISAWLGCRIGFFPEQPNIICSATGPIAKQRTLSLRNQTQIIPWQSLFRNVRKVESMLWRHESWSVAPDGAPFPGRIHPTVAAFGVDGSITGARGRVIACDDIVTRLNARTLYQRTQVKEFVHSTLFQRQMSSGEPGIPSGVSRKVLIGTPYHPDDIYAELEASGRYVVCRTPLLGTEEPVDGVPYYATLTYPDDWPYETLGEAVVRPEDGEAA